MKTTRCYILCSIFLFGLTFYLSSNFYFNRAYKNSFTETCNLVEQKIYLTKPEILKWHHNCLVFAEGFSYLENKNDLIYGLNFLFSLLDLSHLSINTPIEEKALWKGIKWETGLTVISIDNSYYIVDFAGPTKPEGPRFGDKILSINGKLEPTWHDIKYSSGLYQVKRNDEVVSYPIMSQEIKIDTPPLVTAINQETALLKINSFRSEYFQIQDWHKTIKTLEPYSNIIIDIRKNFGGNFTSMLRGLSPFLCNPKKIGTLGKKDEPASDAIFPDNLNDQQQYKALQKHGTLELTTFSGYGCIQANLKILIDNETGSVSEIFAQAIKQLQRGQLIGQVTRGHVLLAVWYDLPVVRGGYTVTIPEANFYDLEKNSIESVGVHPHYHVEYDKDDLESGVDSYIKAALDQLTQTN